MKKFSLRMLTTFLAIAMLIATCSTAVVALDIPYDADGFTSDGREVVTVTDAEIVAKYSFIGGMEESVLSCNAIVGNSHVIPVPADSDELISIDPEGCTVTADTFTSGDYTWKPVKAYLVYTDSTDTDNIKLEIALDENGRGSFETEQQSYSIEVDYEVTVAIDLDTQRSLANAPATLVNGIANMNAVVACESDLETLAREEMFSSLMMMTKETSYGQWNGTIFEAGTPAYIAIRAMDDNRNANNGTFALNNAIDDYNGCDNKVEYLAKNGSDFKTAFEIVSHINTLSDELHKEVTTGMIYFAYTKFTLIDQDTYDSLCDVSDFLVDLSTKLKAVSDADWDVAAGVVKSDATALELDALDLAVSAASNNVSRHDSEELVEAPVAASTTVKAGVAQNKVNVIIDAEVIGSDTINSDVLSKLNGTKGNFLIGEGATEAEISAKISALGLCEKALAYWAENASVYNVCDEFYIPVTTYVSDEETGDVNVTITYTPKTFKISKDYADEETVHYGYNLKLDGHENSNKSYDYTVNGVAKYQGEVIKIAEDTTITRKEGTALKGSTVSSMVADSSVCEFLSDEARAVLKVNAFKAGEYANLFGTLKYRTPAKESVTFHVTETENGYKVSAPSIASGLLSGAEWKAVSVDLLGADDGIINTNNEPVEDGVFEITYDDTVKTVRINYELALDGIAAEDVAELANLPHKLSVEAAGQIEILDKMAYGSLYSALESINGQMGTIVSAVNISDMSQEAKDTAALLKSDCADAAGNVILYNYLTEYRTATSELKNNVNGLKYYYSANNSANIKHQLELLSHIFNTLCPADKEDPDRIAFVNLLEQFGIGDYVEKLDSIREAIDECKSIAPVNEYIDNNSTSLGTLTNAIYNAIGKTEAYSGDGVATYSSSIYAAPDKTSIHVVINVTNGYETVDSVSDSVTLKNGETIGDIIKNMVAKLDAELTINKSFYDVTGMDNIPEGDVAVDSITSDIVITYTPYSYTVSVPGAPDQVFYYGNDRTVTLPASSNSNIKLIYTIEGKTVEVIGESKQYTFESLDVFDENRRYDAITIEEVNIENEKLLNFVNLINSSLTETGASFIPVQDSENNISMVFRTPASLSTDAMMDITTNLTMALAMYDSVELGGSVLWDGSQIHLQSMIDMVANSSFSLDVLCNVIREDGTVINDEALGKLTPMIDVEGNVGGRLMVSTIKLDGKAMSFYVTLSDQTPAEQLAKARSAIVDVKNYVSLVCKDGEFKFVITAPDAVYPYYLTQMLLADKIDITDITKLNLKDSIAYEWSLLKDLLCDENLTMDTFENTLSMLGREADLSQYTNILNAFKSGRKYLADHAEVVSRDAASDEYVGTFMIDLYSAFRKAGDRVGISETMMNFVYEASKNSEPFKVDFHFTLSNIIDKDYDAIVFNLKGEGLTKKFYCTTDLADVLSNVGNNAIIVMTSDVELTGDVYIPQNAIIDLNGFTLTGNISTGGTVRIVDSRFNADEAGTFDGKLGAGKFILTGGKYTADVSAHLTKGYYVNANGYVQNKIYTLTKNGNDIQIALSAEYINNTGLVDFQALLVDVAVDVAMTAYTGAAISVDGNYIYNFSLKDITSIFAENRSDLINSTIDVLDTEGLSNIINSVIAEITDFNALATAINNNEALVDYELAIEHWNIVPYIADDNYVTFDSVPSNKESGRFTVVIEGTDEEKAELATLCKNLSAVDVKEFEININDISYNDGFGVDFNGNVNVHVDLSKNRAYAALICAAAAYNTDDWMKQSVYKAALEEYINGKGANKITEVVENMTAAEFIATCKTVGGLSCETILTGIGIDVSNRTHGMISLFNSYSNLVKICDKVLTRLDITGNGATLAAHKVENTYATYKFQTELVGRVNVTLTITTVPQSDEMIFDIPNIDMADSVVTEKIKGFTNITLADGSNGFAIDATVDGISVESFLSMLNINVEGAVSVSASIRGKTTGLVCTGDVLVITAYDGIDYSTKEYTIVIVGDANSNGQSDIGDAINISNYFKNGEGANLSEAQVLACDLNGNDKVDIGDAVKLSAKYKNQDEYSSAYSSDN